MDASIRQEVYVFFVSVAAGGFLGVIYDGIMLIKKKSFAEKMLSDILDILFWLICVILFFSVVFFANNGKMRFFEFLGVILGYVIYTFTLSRAVVVFFEILGAVFFKIFKFFLKILLTPLIFLYNIVFKGIMFIFWPIFRAFYKVCRRMGRKILQDVCFAWQTVKKADFFQRSRKNYEEEKNRNP